MNLNKKFSFKFFLKQYSLSSNVFGTITRSLRVKYIQKVETDCSSSSLSAGIEYIGEKYISSKYTSMNRNIIKKWILYSKKNNYRLIFSFIPEKIKTETNYLSVKKYIDSLLGEHYSFDDYYNKVCREDDGLYYKYDSHFNEKDNQFCGNIC